MAALEEDEADAEDIFDPGLFLNEDYVEHSYELRDGARQTADPRRVLLHTGAFHLIAHQGF